MMRYVSGNGPAGPDPPISSWALCLSSKQLFRTHQNSQASKRPPVLQNHVVYGTYTKMANIHFFFMEATLKSSGIVTTPLRHQAVDLRAAELGIRQS